MLSLPFKHIFLQVSTEAVVLVNKGMWHIEGGWPKDLDCTESEQTARFIRKVAFVGPPECCMLSYNILILAYKQALP